MELFTDLDTSNRSKLRRQGGDTSVWTYTAVCVCVSVLQSASKVQDGSIYGLYSVSTPLLLACHFLCKRRHLTHSPFFEEPPDLTTLSSQARLNKSGITQRTLSKRRLHFRVLKA